MCSSKPIEVRGAGRMIPSDPLQLDLEEQSNELSATGSKDSDGTTGPPSPSVHDTVRMVRRHTGRATISAGFLTRFPDREPATFIVLRQEPSDVYTVTVSLQLTQADARSLERALTMPGEAVSVAVRFAPTSPNLVPPTTAAST